MKRSEDDVSNLSDEELRARVADSRPSPLVDAFFIGFLIGIIVYGTAMDTLGFVLLVPLLLIYVLLKKPRRHEALRRELSRRES